MKNSCFNVGEIVYKIPDVSPDAIAEVVESLCESNSLTIDEIAVYINKTPIYAKRVVSACEQLELLTLENNIAKSTTNSLDLGKATKEQRPEVFKTSLIMFSPFILFAKLIMKGDNLEDSARKVKVIFKVPESVKIIESTLRRWGTYTGLLIKEKNTYRIKFTVQEIDEEYLKELIDATHDKFKAQMFIANKLDDTAFSYLTNVEKERFIKALQKYREEPEDAAKDASNSFESFLFRVGEDHELETEKFIGIEVIANSLKSSNIILEQHRKICAYHSALRNAANHGVDKTMGVPWKIESDASLELILSELTTIRSILRYINKKELVI